MTEPVEGFLAETIAGQKERPGHPVMDREGEHPVETLQQPLAPFPVPVEQDFGVGMIRLEGMTQRLQTVAQFPVIVDLPVEDNGETAVRRRHRLGAAGKVDDREATVPEVDSPVVEISLGIGPAVGERPGHPAEDFRAVIPGPAGRDEAGDAAHQSGWRFRVSFTR